MDKTSMKKRTKVNHVGGQVNGHNYMVLYTLTQYRDQNDKYSSADWIHY